LIHYYDAGEAKARKIRNEEANDETTGKVPNSSKLTDQMAGHI